MHSTDIIAWHVNGCVICADCGTIYEHDQRRADADDASPVFADHAGEENGATCADCGACLVSTPRCAAAREGGEL